MKSEKLYKLTADSLIFLGIFLTLATTWINASPYLGSPYILQALLNGLIKSIGILILLLLPGIYYLKIKQKNKMTDISVNLSLIAIILALIALTITLLICPLKTGICEGWGIITFAFLGAIPATLLYTIAIILLLINKFK